MAYETKTFPFRPDMVCLAVRNTDTNKTCKFMVTVGDSIASCSVGIRAAQFKVHGTRLFIDTRSPTPGFPAPDEMSKDEVTAEFDEMAKVICGLF